jgi:hypothetical protein
MPWETCDNCGCSIWFDEDEMQSGDEWALCFCHDCYYCDDDGNFDVLTPEPESGQS